MTTQPQRSARMSCDRPFDPGITADPYKLLVCDQFKALFSGTCAASASVTPSKGSKGGTPVSVSSASCNKLKKKGRTPTSVSSASCNKLKKNRGATKVFDKNGHLTVQLLDKIKGGLSGRNYLSENEIELIHVLLSTFCNGALKSKKTLSASDLRMLGQLVVLAFRNVTDGKPVSLANFPGRRNISIAKLPLQYKLGDEKHNQVLFDRRIKTGKTWMGYLPGEFNDKLISKMFLEIDPSKAQRTIRKYQSNHLRLAAKDSFALKDFVGMSDMSYIKFNQAMFYFSGSWFLAPISHVREIRIAAKKNITQACPAVWLTCVELLRKAVLRFTER